MRKQLFAAIRMVLVLTLVTGVVFPLLVVGIGRVFGGRADGSLVRDSSGAVVGSSLVGQEFTGDRYFQGRPSAAGRLASGSKGDSADDVDPLASGASNLGPTNPVLISRVQNAVDAYRIRNQVPDGVDVPVDAVTSSGSGVDPDISVENARLQAGRVAAVRGISVDTVMSLIDEATKNPDLGFLGSKRVNVLALNMLLDAS
jgi:K+-transporting ATPase ATPase C chain